MIPSKIAVLCNYELLPTRVGGMDYFFWLFDEKCKENNIEVDWFFPNIAIHESYKKLTIIDTNYQNVEVFFANYCEINKEDYTFVITHFVELCSPVFKKISSLTSAKIIAVDHNPRPLNGYSLKRKILKRLKGLLYSKYIDLFVSVSDYSKNQLIKEFGIQIKNKTKVIFNGLDTHKFVKKTNYNFKNKFIVASHLRKDKGIQDLIYAIAMLHKEIPLNVSIDVYGKGYYEDFLKNLTLQLKVDSYFNFKGSVNDLNQIYYQYDYLIHPSHGETFCYSVVEALICRVPVITTKNQGNVLGLVENRTNGFLFEVENKRQLKAILKEIILDNLQIDNSVNYNAKVDEMTLDKMIYNYLKLINVVL